MKQIIYFMMFNFMCYYIFIYMYTFLNFCFIYAFIFIFIISFSDVYGFNSDCV